MGSLFGKVGDKSVELNVEIGLTSGRCFVYRGGWGLPYMVAELDGILWKITVLKRGWFFSKVALTLDGEPAVLETENDFGDFLRKLYGSDLYK